MSQWHEVKNCDIQLENEDKEVYVYVTANDFGSVYVILTYAQIKKIAADIAKAGKP